MCKYLESVRFIGSNSKLHPRIAIVLGSGLGDLVQKMEVETVIPYAKIPLFPVSTVAGHRGELVLGVLNGVEVCVLNGRKHYYEGSPMQDVVEPLNILHEFGVRVVILSNAAGGLNPSFRVGDVMLMEDHINFMFANPLEASGWCGKVSDSLAPAELYSKQLRKMALQVAARDGIKLQKGVYLAHSGPYFGTHAESAMQFHAGADAVGMSTIPEAIQAHAIGMETLAFSVITDLAVIGSTEHPTHEMVLEAARNAGVKLSHIVEQLLPLIKFDDDDSLVENVL